MTSSGTSFQWKPSRVAERSLAQDHDSLVRAMGRLLDDRLHPAHGMPTADLHESGKGRQGRV
jgi:hypothetical protein